MRLIVLTVLQYRTRKETKQVVVRKEVIMSTINVTETSGHQIQVTRSTQLIGVHVKEVYVTKAPASVTQL